MSVFVAWQSLVVGGRYRPVRLLKPKEIYLYRGCLNPMYGSFPSRFIRFAEIALSNRSDREQLVQFLWQRPHNSKLWRPDFTHPGGWVFATELRIPPNSVGRWDIPFHTADLNGWPAEQLNPMELGYFTQRYKLTLVVMTESGRRTSWRRARLVRVRD